VSLFHWRERRRVSLLAAGVLRGREREETLAHLERCAGCRAEHEELRGLVGAMERDPVRTADPDLALSVLVARVQREVEATLLTPTHRPRLWLVALPATAAVLAVAVVVPPLIERVRQRPVAVRATIPQADAGPLVTEEALSRIERNLAREHAARYLSEASEVLVTVAASGADCDRKDDRLDVGLAPERSRELLAKRRLVVEAGGEAVASARGVLDDVEMALRDVAELPSCVRRRDVDRVRYEVERRQLLMRIRLMTRELEG
jgi:hypothetical protein